jgi:hypothetical protein
MYVILKEITNSNGVKVNIIIINNQCEIWEFDSFDEANKMKDIFEANSDSGYKYTVKKIGNEI